MTLPDAKARDRIRCDLDTTFFVEAAAGTGKTTALISRIVEILRQGRSTLDRIVAVTFTEKAAGEMKIRLREAIEEERARETCVDDERRRFEAALGHLEVAHIGTIHGFCSDLLRERPVEARVDPRFAVAAEDDSQRVLDEAFDTWFEGMLDDPPEGLRRILRRGKDRADDVGPRTRLRIAASKLVDRRDFTAPWRRDPTFDRNAAIDMLLPALADLAELAGLEGRDDWLGKNLKNIQRCVNEIELRERVGDRDHDSIEAELRRLAARKSGWHWRGRGRRYGDLDRAEVIERRDAMKEALDQFVTAADADVAACLREELQPVIGSFQTLKSLEGALDFLDLLIDARDLIRTDARVRTGLQQRFTHFFVDEFQDTDPLQAEILLLLAASDADVDRWDEAVPVPGKLFIVGDPKQSIYRFRRADVTLYQRIKRRLATQGAEVLHLTTSFRAVPTLQRAVNAAFMPLMTGGDEGSQADYVALEPFRADVETQPSVVALPVPHPFGRYGKVNNYAIDASCPEGVGAWIDWLVNESGWTVTERGDGTLRRPVEPRHVCILFRRMQAWGRDVTRPYVAALETRGVPHVLVGGRSYHDREEVAAMRSAMHAIEWPDDTLRVFATLRGPFFALHDDAILAFRERTKSLHPLRRLDDDDLAALDEPEREVAVCLDILGRLHAGRNRRPIAETMTRLLAAVRAHAGLAIWPTGEQALANTLRLIDLARRFERGGASSFRSFVERLEDEAERGMSAEAPIVEEGTDGVRIMTVHKAKGLEFPVVILADPTCRATRDMPSQHVDSDRGLWAVDLCGAVPHDVIDNRDAEAEREHEEAVRLTYVAATRARDVLVVPTVGVSSATEEDPGWTAMLKPVLFPPPEGRGHAGEAPGVPEFGRDSVVEYPDTPQGAMMNSVAPGLHRSLADSDVVWWDPTRLGLDREARIALRQERILVPDDAGVAEAGAEAHDAWQTRRHDVLESGVIPSVTVRAATDWAHEHGRDGDGAIEEVGSRAGRPGGPRFGTLVHAVLEEIDFDASRVMIEQVVDTRARTVGADEAEREAAATTIEHTLAHPVLRRAAAATDVRRECPILTTAEGGTIVEGIVDLAFREETRDGGRWVVIDFKTDLRLDDRRDRYLAQVQLYADAIERATGEPATGMLLLV